MVNSAPAGLLEMVSLDIDGAERGKAASQTANTKSRVKQVVFEYWRESKDD
jgi:hypothetical protein